MTTPPGATRILDKSFLTSVICLPDEIVIRILSFCTLEQILALNKASWLTRSLVRFYTRYVWSFERRFRLWFTNVTGFQKMLCSCRAVVAGSQALQFFDRTFDIHSDLDVYVYQGYVKNATIFLFEEGYALGAVYARPDVRNFYATKISNDYKRGSHGTSVTLVANFDKEEVLWDGTLRRRRVRLIGLEVTPIVHIVHEFHSTGVMNFVSATFAVSIFPRSTFLQRKTKILRESKSPQDWDRDYSSHGFTVESGDTDRSVIKPPEDITRSTLDGLSWKIYFSGPVTVLKRRCMEEKFLSIPFETTTTGIARVNKNIEQLPVMSRVPWVCIKRGYPMVCGAHGSDVVLKECAEEE